jgi:hypothetical protein
MAVVVPLLISAAAGAAGWGATATLLATTAGALVSSKVGLSKKIDNAASKVFGKDLVRVGNVVGAFFVGDAAQFGANAAGQTAGYGASLAAQAASKAANTAVASSATNPALIESAVQQAATVPGVDAIGGMETALEAANNSQSAIGSSSASAAVAKQKAAQGALNAVRAAPPIDPMSGIKMPQALSNAGEAVSKAWNGMGDKTQAAMTQVAGNVVQGGMQGYSQAKLAEEQYQRRLEEEERNRQLYRSGSGLRLIPQVGGALDAIRQPPRPGG